MKEFSSLILITSTFRVIQQEGRRQGVTMITGNNTRRPVVIFVMRSNLFKDTGTWVHREGNFSISPK